MVYLKIVIFYFKNQRFTCVFKCGRFLTGEKKQVCRPVFFRNFNKCLKTLKLKHLKLDLILAVFAGNASGYCCKCNITT